jgi:hypothetical protein
MDMGWSFGSVWNDALELSKSYEPRPRENIWAGEVGSSYIDRFLKMRGTIPTNPPNARSKRKFEAGNMLEWLVQMVLKRCDVLREGQTWLKYQYPGLLEVTGKLDFLAGGTPDWERARHELDHLGLPEFFGRAAKQIIEHLAETYPCGLKDIILECKSCSSMMWDIYEKHGADKRHQAQLYHYLKAKNMDEGHVLYVSKDDLRLLELGLSHPDPTVEAFYKGDIEKMTHYIRSNEQPPLEAEVVFNDTTMKFAQNFKVAYSNYLSMLYGFENQMAFEGKWKKVVGQWNRTFGRCVKGSNMTKLNMETIISAKKMFPNWDELVDLAKSKGTEVEDDTDD